MNDWSAQIEEDLRWREAELASLKLLAVESLSNSVRERTLLRALWALLYAHYEGFCKFAWDLYLDSLEKMKLKRGSCRPEIATLSLRRNFKTLGANLAPTSVWDFFHTQLPRLLEEPISFDMRLETESNLWPSILKENSSLACLACKTIAPNESKLKALVSRRNSIAHGEKMIVKDLDEYFQYEAAALLVMHELAVEVLDALESGSYRKVGTAGDSQP